MDKKTRITLIFIMSLAVLLCPLINAANIGISPASISFEQVLRGGYSERNIIISSDSLEPLRVEVSPSGDISNWLNIPLTNFTVTKNSPYVLKVAVVPPLDTPNGDYGGTLRFKIYGSTAPKEGRAVGTIIPALDLTINTEVTDTEIIQCGVSSYVVNSAEKGDDIVFNLDISNEGNIRLKPRIKIDIWDKNQISIIKSQEFNGNEILPSTGSLVSLRMKSDDLDVGQYFVEVSAPECHSSKLLTFDVLEVGALKANGLLLDIKISKIANAGETVPIVVRFENIGEKEVDAQFRGKISLGNEIIQILESEKVNVPISQINRFDFYFTPKKLGKYTISGNVFYSNKKTFESSAILEVISKDLVWSSFLTPLVFIFFLFFILFLFYQIHKERKKYQDKLRRLR